MQQFQSEDISSLLVALMRGHQECGVVIPKDKKGHKGTYAALPQILSFIHTMGSKHGLILHQSPRILEGNAAIETILSHPASGQWISGISLLTPSENPVSMDQALGGSSTYHRRYDAMAICGLFAEDDPSDNDGDTETTPSKSSYISEKQLWLLNQRINKRTELEKIILTRLKITKLSDIPYREFNAVLAYVDAYTEEK